MLQEEYFADLQKSVYDMIMDHSETQGREYIALSGFNFLRVHQGYPREVLISVPKEDLEAQQLKTSSLPMPQQLKGNNCLNIFNALSSLLKVKPSPDVSSEMEVEKAWGAAISDVLRYAVYRLVVSANSDPTRQATDHFQRLHARRNLRSVGILE